MADALVSTRHLPREDFDTDHDRPAPEIVSVCVPEGEGALEQMLHVVLPGFVAAGDEQVIMDDQEACAVNVE